MIQSVFQITITMFIYKCSNVAKLLTAVLLLTILTAVAIRTGSHVARQMKKTSRKLQESKPTTIKQTTPPPPPRKFNISSAFDVDKLGNLLFQYASLLGIAQNYNMNPVVSSSNKLNLYFNLSAQVVNTTTRPGLKWEKVFGARSNSFEHDVMEFATPWTTNIELIGYFQSWHYFKDVREKLKDELVPIRYIRTSAARFVSVAREKFKLENNGVEPVVVGVHVRRGEMLEERFADLGYTVAGADYVRQAMEFFKQKYANVLFIVCSDDIDWCEKTLSELNPSQVVFSRHNDDITDLSILSQSDHMIISTGVFSWWAGWFCNGTVVYYKDFPQSGSRLEQLFSTSKDDYFLPGWIPM